MRDRPLDKIDTEAIVTLEYQMLRAHFLLEWFIGRSPLTAGTLTQIHEQAMQRLNEGNIDLGRESAWAPAPESGALTG